MIKNPNKHNKENMENITITDDDRLQLGDLVWVAVNRSHQLPVSQTTFVLCAITYIPRNLGEVWRLWGDGQEYLEYYWNMCTTYNVLLMEHPEGLSMLGLPRDYWTPLFRRSLDHLRRHEKIRQEIGGSSSDESQGKR
jgi:hypothetical protein